MCTFIKANILFGLSTTSHTTGFRIGPHWNCSKTNLFKVPKSITPKDTMPIACIVTSIVHLIYVFYGIRQILFSVPNTSFMKISIVTIRKLGYFWFQSSEVAKICSNKQTKN